MNLLVDVGNTNTVFGLWATDMLKSKWRVSTKRLGTEDEIYMMVKEFLNRNDCTVEELEDLCVASVVPAVNNSFRYFAEKYINKDALFVTAREDIGVKWDVDFPPEIGSDRVANILGAKSFYGENAIVIDVGTAITVDVLKDGAFLGGAIIPGPHVSMKALFSGTAKLPQVELHFVKKPIGRNTADNIRIGIINTTFFGLKSIVMQIVEKYPAKPVIIATGGYAKLFDISKDFFDFIDTELTLKGIREYCKLVRKLEENTAH
ncbi:MAG: type III pantothenate kinase [Kosmotoga sp.]|uniref:type III pantothenate kinase n=1 Tax=Kosmotoga sp. TaxID=1955248 RepID=UPI0025BF4C9A|nr:type III pantothenate kinase [Kosmotoga sp.]MCD6160748.1 type III pantothenate kinase [Kosmotoga sp.]